MPVRFLRHPQRVDALIAASGLLGGLLLWLMGLYYGKPVGGLPTWLSLVALVVMSGTELLRRRAPLTALAIGTAAVTLDICTGTLLATVVMYTDLVYAAVLYGSPATARRIPRACEIGTVVATLLALALMREPAALLLGITFALITVAPAWTGVGIRVHRDRAEAARLAAERTALLAELDRREAVGAERARMARELHDMVAGHLSAIAIHSSAALSIDEPGASREALGVIRENSVQGLAEMRRLIGLLREQAKDADEPAPTPTLAGLDALLEQARTAVRDDRFSFVLHDGRGPGALPVPVELAAYRIVQESLTNAVKHAAPGEVSVALARDDGALVVRIASVLGDRPGPRAPGAGAGLTGMRERVALLGGELAAGPAEGKFWEVRALLPVDEEETR
ncbi:sensor histidine kinase [Streptomyces griseocarneus]|uniref:sensor histidine kinase n=1 Tax=Streptomyces griseocarneus TaxID=51201 RepID=UPI00167E363E|nr:histidine kinase [Streptomyces griseocarneus]MBZ6473510.1 histidine kinase [Streptomyces griseocarneus]GHG56531.1 two-component sensor histidine kinase [Streptomyces griseocarneus]